MAKSKYKIDPKIFDELDAGPRKITPRMLTGKQRATFEALAQRWHEGRYTGVKLQVLFEWTQKHCGITCHKSSFRTELLATKPETPAKTNGVLLDDEPEERLG